MAYVEGVAPRTWFGRLACWMARRQLGRVPAPMRLYARAPRLLHGVAHLENALAKAPTEAGLSPRLGSLAMLRVAQRVGCPF